MKKLISTHQAEEYINSHINIAETEAVSLVDAQNRFLRETILADRPIPPFDRVMMDGIAIQSSDFFGIGTSFSYAGTQAAGTEALKKTEPQSYFEVMTGAVLPSGCDCVIPVEEISIENHSAILSPDAIVEEGKFIHKKGSDAFASSILVNSGCLLRAPELAIAASVGKTKITVSKLPRVTILTSGDEVLPASSEPSDFQIRSSHPHFLSYTIESNNLGKCNHFHIPDEQKATRKAIASSLENSDFIILTGGISKGKFDFVASELLNIVGAPVFHGVIQRPGKPFAFWLDQKSETTIFALPGNPVSVAATTARYVIPALKAHRGDKKINQTVNLANSFDWKAPIPGFAPCNILSNFSVEVNKMQNSGDYLCLAGCSGFVEFDQPSNTYPENSQLSYYSL